MNTKRTIEELGWITIEHAPYSPDKAPSDFWLFRHLQNYLDGAILSKKEDAVDEVKNFLNSRPPDFFREGIYRAPKRWEKIVEFKGEYFEG